MLTLTVSSFCTLTAFLLDYICSIQSKCICAELVTPLLSCYLILAFATIAGGLTSRIPVLWSQILRKAVLGVILARAGLSMVRTV